jgi:hypothetical protein
MQGGAFFGPLIIQLGIVAWGIAAILIFSGLARSSEEQPAWSKYLRCGVAAAFGAAMAILAYGALFMVAPLIAILLLPILLIGAIVAACRA